MCKSVEEIKGLHRGSTDIYKQDMEGRYIDRPNSHYKNGIYGTVD